MADKLALEKQAEDLELSADFILETQPTAQLEEEVLIPEYTEAASQLRQYVMTYFKAVTKLTRDHAAELGEEQVTSWKTKLANYSRDVARRAKDLSRPISVAP